MSSLASGPDTTPQGMEVHRLAPDVLEVRLWGSWRLSEGLPQVGEVEGALEADPALRSVRFDTAQLEAWDSALVTLLDRLARICGERGLELDLGGVPEGARRLVQLASAVPRQPGRPVAKEVGPVARTGEVTLEILAGGPRTARFVGEVWRALARALRGRASFRRSELWLTMQQVGPEALPIVTLISFLVGVILAYMGALQLAQFGAQIFIADLVGIGMVRELGALMVGILLAGRSGAAFAAQIGTMQVNEEVDALRTLGIQPVEFLVVPRLVALVLMAPLLTLYASLAGILAGLFVSVTVLGIDGFEYVQQTLRSLNLDNLLVGLSKGTVYGALVALAGCLRGMQCGRSAQAVGEATTSAVVTSILWIVDRGRDPDRRLPAPRLLRWNTTSPLPETAIEVQDLTLAYGSSVIQRDLSFRVRRGDVFVVMGGSGCGKSTLLRVPDRAAAARPPGVCSSTGPTSGPPSPAEQQDVKRAPGGAVPERRAVELDDPGRERRAAARASTPTWARARSARSSRSSWRWSGWPASRTSTRPRSAAACASAPAWRAPWRSTREILFFDEPSAGLDPISSRRLDDLILELRDSLGTTIVVVTHELASIFAIADDSVFLDAETRTMIARGDPRVLRTQSPDERVRAFLNRGAA